MTIICNSSASEFPVPDECLNPTNEQVRSACDCLAQTNSNIYNINQYCASLQAWQKKKEEYERYQTKLSEWNQQRKNARAEFQKTRKRWKNCIPHGSEQRMDLWCFRDVGYGWDHTDYEYHVSNCAGFYGICTPNSEGVRVYEENWKNSNPAPGAPGGEAEVPPPGDIPDFKNISNVQCCSQIFSNINADTSNISNISQNCHQIIQNQIAAATAPSPTEASTTAAAPVPMTTTTLVPTKLTKKPTTTKPPSKKGSPFGDEKIMWIAAVILCCCCCAALVLAFFMFK